MKKRLLSLILILIVGLTLASFSPGIFASKPAAARDYELFFGAVARGEAAAAHAQLHGRFKKFMDEALMAAFSRAVKQRLGALEAVSLTKVQKHEDRGEHAVESEADLRFERGSATARLLVRHTDDGIRIGSFDLTAPALVGWLEDTQVVALSEQRARRFIELSCAGEEERAWALLDEQLQQSIGREKFRGMIAAAEARIGPARGLTLERSVEQEVAKSHIFDFTVRGAKRTVRARCRFRAGSFRSGLFGFKFEGP